MPNPNHQSDHALSGHALSGHALSDLAGSFAFLIAAVGWVALGLQLFLTIGLIEDRGGSLLDAVWRYVGYFTILTDIAVVGTMTLVAANRWPGGTDSSPSFLSGVTFAIVIVGVVYHVLLSGLAPDMAWASWVTDRLLHYVTPAMTVLFWIAFVPKHGLTMRDPFLWMTYPIVYLVYALIRGAADGWYAYYFFDVSVLGYGRALINASGVSAILLGFGLAVVALSRAVSRRRAAPARQVDRPRTRG